MNERENGNTDGKKRRLLSLVVSAYNESQVLDLFYTEASAVLTALSWDYEIIFVNDGSHDATPEIINRLCSQDGRVKAIHFSRNFGHEAAMIAGIDHACGDGIVCMDADLQHPPSILPEIVGRFDQGFDVISMVRTSNVSAGWLKNVTSNAFYGLINRISEAGLIKNASDFICISSRVAEVLRRNFREKIRFLRGYVQNLGFKRTVIEYAADVRRGGESKYSIRKLIKLSMNTIVCFSDFPLRLGTYAGIFASMLGVILMIYTIVSWAREGTPNGYATIIVMNCFMFALLFLLVGIIGEYIAVLFSELKDRPIYLVEETRNMEERKKE